MKKRKVIEAIAEKINNIVNESNGKLTVNKIASKSCLTQSTVQHIMDKSYKDVKLLTIVRLCDGLGLTLKEFFSDELFDNIDQAADCGNCLRDNRSIGTAFHSHPDFYNKQNIQEHIDHCRNDQKIQRRF